MIRMSVVSLFILMVFGCAVLSDSEPWKPYLEVKAEALTAGPYGEYWQFEYDGYGNLSFEASYMLNPMGRIEGGFLPNEAYLQTLQNAVDDNHFFALNADIGPVMRRFHSPIFSLTISDEHRTHTVTLEDPARLEDQEILSRFMEVWEAVFSILPIQPDWKGPTLHNIGAGSPESSISVGCTEC